MKLSMSRGRAKNIEIVRRIVLDVLVNTMNYFFRFKKSPDNSFSNKPMFCNKRSAICERMIGFVDTNISIGSSSFATFPAFTVSSRMGNPVLFFCLFSVSFTKKMAAMIFANSFTYFSRPFSIYHAFVITFSRAKDFFASSLSRWFSFKFNPTNWAYT